MKRLSLSGVLLLLCLQGCSFFQGQPKQNFYSLSAPRPGSGAGSSYGKTLSVSALQIHPSYENQNFVYRLPNGQVENDYYNLFLIAPDSNITEQLKNWLRKSNKLKAVTGYNQSLAADYILTGSVDSLYGDFTNKKAPSAVFSLRVSLTEVSSGNRKAIGLYERRIPLSQQTPNGLVAGWNKALVGVFQEIEKDLASQIP